MSKVFTSEEFINKLKWLANDVPTVYHSGSGWSQLNSNGKWRFDCVVSIKCILWGFKADKNLFRGGTKYRSNGVEDFTCNGGVEKYSTDVSRDFSKLVPGEYLCMKGTKYNHAGVYLGNGKVFECTTAWGIRRCMISDINNKGERSYKGVKSVPWTYHGKLIYIDYKDEPKPMNQVAILQTKMNEQWNCGLAVDGHFGPLTTKACQEHQLTFRINAPIMVKWLQNRLIELGYSVGKSGVDGGFGYDTLNAVKKYQKDHRLKVDGIVGKNTYYELTK